MVSMEAKQLPENISVCHQMIAQLFETVHQLQRLNGQLEHRIDQLLRRYYGPRSERISPEELLPFAEDILGLLKAQGAEEEIKKEDTVESDAPAKPKHKGHGRRTIPSNLPRKQQIHDLSEAEKLCSCCGQMMTRIGEEKSEQLDYEPSSLFVVEHLRYTYACKHCEESIVTADKSTQPIEKGLAGAGLLSHVIVSKYADHQPLYRLEGIFRRNDIELPRSTLCGWMAQSAQLLGPLYKLMKEEVLRSRVIHTDDTPVRVQDKSIDKTRTGRFWVYLGDCDHPYAVYEYTPNRSREGPDQFLGDYKGYLQADAFGGYDGIYVSKPIIETLCWAHARRKFYDARNIDSRRAHSAMAWIKMLYKVEDRMENLSFDEIRGVRQKETVPILNEFKTWLESHSETDVLPKSPMRQAINYCLKNWDALKRYTENGELSIDNNAAERAVKPIALGRKNWLFCGSDNGGMTAAILFSLTQSAKLNKVEPFRWLREVIARISDHPANKLAELLPDRWQKNKIQ
jgi:transposase